MVNIKVTLRRAVDRRHICLSVLADHHALCRRGLQLDFASFVIDLVLLTILNERGVLGQSGPGWERMRNRRCQASISNHDDNILVGIFEVQRQCVDQIGNLALGKLLAVHAYVGRVTSVIVDGGYSGRANLHETRKSFYKFTN